MCVLRLPDIPCIRTLVPGRAGSDGSMSASGSAGPGFDPWQDCKFSFENFQPSGLGGLEIYTF